MMKPQTAGGQPHFQAVRHQGQKGWEVFPYYAIIRVTNQILEALPLTSQPL